jgi:hypothetical protein
MLTFSCDISPKPVNDFDRRIRGSFEIQQFAPLCYDCFDCLVVRRITKGHCDLEARQELNKKLVGPAVGVFD